MNRVAAFLRQLSQRQDLLIAAVLIVTVAMMVLPVPTEVVDLFIGCNLGMAVLLLMVSVYLRTPLEFAVLPGVILISTVFRLSLSVTTTRLILVQADAGQIIETFGEFVIAGNVVVGLVVFMIITIVQFVVVTKGAERVAEVGARFTLDALPGKQMSIDADVRSGDIDQAEARRRRQLVEKESQLHGAMDGAMKFVKGDAIAGLIIIAVNLVGGITIGTVQRGLPFGEALHTYTLLTVGDALISQIPALFLSITSAIIVTRVSSEDAANLGRDIVGQLVAERRALWLAAAVLLGMALIPGFPWPVFLLLAAVFGVSAYLGGRRPARPDAFPQDAAPGPAGPEGNPADPGKAPAPVRVLLSPDLHDLVGRTPGLGRTLALAQQQVTEELGITCPSVGWEPSVALEGMRYCIEIDGVPMDHADARPHHLLLRDDPVHLELLGVDAEQGPPVLDAQPSWWIEARHLPRLLEAGLGFNDCAEVMGWQVRNLLRKHAPSFLGIQETKALLARAERDYPDLVREATKALPIQKVADVLRRLLEERVSIRSFRLILEALADWSERENRVILLTEYVRAALGRQICHCYANPHKVLTALIAEQDVEQVLREALRETSVGVYLALDNATSDKIIGAVRTRMGGIEVERATPVIIASLDVRRYLRTLLVKNGLDIPVLSYQDLAADFPVQPLGSIGLGPAPAPLPMQAGD